MGVKSTRENIRVEVQAPSAGDFGFAFVSGITSSPEQEIRDCENIAAQIRRHVDGLPSGPSRGVCVVWDIVKSCEYCGSAWTEKSNEYNGGCCEEDEYAKPPEGN